MGFMDNLSIRSNSGIFGQPRREDDEDVLSLVNRLRDRDMQDYKDRANFNADLSLRQEQRMRELWDPNKNLDNRGLPRDMNVNPIPHNVFSPDQQLWMKERAEKPQLDLEKEQLNIEGKRLAQADRFREQEIGVKTAQEKLNELKNQQINETKQADLERKINESNQKFELAKQSLESKNANFESQLQARKEMSDAIEERHKLEMERKQHEFDSIHELNKQKLAQAEEKLKQAGLSEVSTEVDESGNKKTTTIKKGSEAEKVQVIDKYGRKATIPKNKLDDPNEQKIYGWKLAGG